MPIPRRSRRRLAARLVGLLTIVVLGCLAYGEIQTSWLQSQLFPSLARQLTYQVEPGPSPHTAYPHAGPYDHRLGYAALPGFMSNLAQAGFAIERQARLSKRHLDFIGHGGFAIYREKTQAGLDLLDRRGEPLLSARHPARIYPSFDAIPPLVVDTLLFVENRELLDMRHPARNPAVEWDRLLVSSAGLLAQLADPTINLGGGSTLATQMEKYRHAPEGRTATAPDKLRQMLSASLRAYQHGADTTDVRRRIVVDYLNSTPLSARPGFGEVMGLGDGLLVWFGTDFDHANDLLLGRAPDLQEGLSRPAVYRQVLSLLLAQRRPSHYLIAGRKDLARLTDSYLRLLMTAGVIDLELGRQALAARLHFQEQPPSRSASPFVEQKAANAVRRELLKLLGLPSTYQLDRLDLEVATSLDLPTQRRVSELLQRLDDAAVRKELGLHGERLLQTGAAGDSLVYSVTLYERGLGANHVRVQADNLNRPFDVNQGAKLDLGSTAKLRTLITYLEIIAELHGRLASLPPDELRAATKQPADPLTVWSAQHLASTSDTSLAGMLEAAMLRRYSASPSERFFTGGGLHSFANFDKRHNSAVLSVAAALRDSVNLVFIRMMRDIVRYHMAMLEPSAEAVLDDPKHPARHGYLVRFADHEGSVFLNRFHRDLAGLEPDALLDRLAEQVGPRPARLATLYRSVRPQAPRDEFATFVRRWAKGQSLSEREIDRLYDGYAIERYSLADRGYIARLHPLKLWLAAYLQDHPNASRSEVLAASADERQASYAWLFKTSRKQAQDKRIRILLEEEAFARIHAAWRRLGYPFAELVPSYASSIGSSADRPEALAELMGIIVNDGVWQPTVRVERLHFAAETPYETMLGFQPRTSRQVLAPEIAAVVRRALIEVVEQGTARRLHQAFTTPDGGTLVVGAKTGTGDHRRKTFAPGGRLLDSQAVNRTATVVFFVGDDIFGTVTIYVSGPEAADFGFTSSLPAQLLKSLAGAIQPLLDERGTRTADAASAGGA